MCHFRTKGNNLLIYLQISKSINKSIDPLKPVKIYNNIGDRKFVKPQSENMGKISGCFVV